MSDTPQEQPRKVISAEEFIKIWKGEYRNKEEYKDCYRKGWKGEELIVFEGYKVTGHIIIKEQKELLHIELRNTVAGYFTIVNSTTGDFSIRDNSRTGYFWIQDNSTTGDFSIQGNSRTGYFWIQDNSTTGDFSIRGNSRTSYFSIQDNSRTGYFSIQDNSRTGYFSIRGNSRTSDFSIRGNSRAGDFIIEDNSRTGDFIIEDNSTTGDFWIEDNSTTGDFSIEDNSTTGDFSIEDNSTTGDFWIEDNSTTGDFWIEDNSATGDFSIRDNSVLASIYVNASSVQKIHIENGVHIGAITLIYLKAECKTLEIEDSTIGKLKLKLDKAYQITIKKKGKDSVIQILDFKESIFPKDAYLHISDTGINEMNLDSFLNHGTIVLNNITSMEEVKQILTNEYGGGIRYEEGEQKGEYQFEQIDKGSKISLINSDLGNTQFIGCDLVGFKTFEFKNSKMAGVFLADTQIPHRKKITTVAPFTRGQQLAQQRLALSQFKKVYESRGDVVNATELRAQELEAHGRYLVRKGVFKNIVELFNLWLNKLSGNYGNNWLLAAIAALSVNWLFFWWYSSEVGYSIGSITNTEHRATFLKLFSYSFEFLNPIRKHSTLTDEKLITPMARIIDYIGRIFIAYFVYQTIQAFRKFGRKSA